MTRRVFWSLVVGLTCFLVAVLGGLAFVPQLLYPHLTDAELHAVPSTETRIQLQQAQGQLQNNARSTILQAVAGLLVIAGAVATWRQVQVNREGQITERFTRAIEQIGSENVDIRLGAIYALERISRNSPTDRHTIQFMLAAFVRNHAAWHVGAPNGPEHPTATVEERAWLQILAPDVQAAVGVLARRLPAPVTRGESPTETRLYLSRVDLRGMQLYRGRQLVNTQFRYANLARSWLEGTIFDHSDLKSADLRRCRLQQTSFVEASLIGAYLSGANLRGADLRKADLRGADLSDAELDGARLEGAVADATTTWPADFDLERIELAGVRLIRPK
ncbi:pentapeptide repeat-containing protein [Actinophytocola sp.]|uniref:pentapeptide repeat-containing protein n=1 Tax=Actinophytocola sp. TaxID=1872138 RepID=UPI002ED22E4D